MLITTVEIMHCISSAKIPLFSCSNRILNAPHLLFHEDAFASRPQCKPKCFKGINKGVVISRALFLSPVFTPKGNVLLTNNRGCDQKHSVYLSVPSSSAKAGVPHQSSFGKAKTINLFLTCPAKCQGLAVFVQEI